MHLDKLVARWLEDWRTELVVGFDGVLAFDQSSSVCVPISIKCHRFSSVISLCLIDPELVAYLLVVDA